MKKKITTAFVMFVLSLLMFGAGYAQAEDVSDGKFDLIAGIVFIGAVVTIGVIGISGMKYRDKTIMIFLIIIALGCFPTLNLYFSNLVIEPKNTVTIVTHRYGFDVEGQLKVGEPTKVITYSTDVTHSIFVKELGINLQSLPGHKEGEPGRPNWTIVVPRKEGTYKILCIEYCGEGHGTMSTSLAGEIQVSGA